MLSVSMVSKDTTFDAMFFLRSTFAQKILKVSISSAFSFLCGIHSGKFGRR